MCTGKKYLHTLLVMKDGSKRLHLKVGLVGFIPKKQAFRISTRSQA
jgi:hypothetical protein